MTNDSNEETIIDSQETNETEEIEQSEPQAEESREEKPRETPEAKLARLQGIRRRLDKQAFKLESELGLNSEEKPQARREEKSGDLDYGQKAYLKAYGVAGSDELALVREYMASGKSIDDIVDNKHFKNDLADLREVRDTKEATPSTSKRSVQASRDTVEYWLNKGEMPPDSQQQLQRDVLNARIKRDKDTSKFSNNPVVNT